MKALLVRSVALSFLAGGLVAQEEGGAPGFVGDVWPILEARCIECHGAKKQKAGLRLDTREGLLEGDEGWIPVVAGKVGESYLMERVGLPDGDSERMPPKGERVSEEEVGVLRRWIEAGAEWEVPPAPKVDPREAAWALEPMTAEMVEGVARAREWFEGQGVRVLAVAQGMEAVEVNLSLLGDRAQGEVVTRLEGLAPVLVHLNLSRTAVGDGALEVVGRLGELRHLNLARTQVGDEGVKSLRGLSKLTYLNLYGTGVGDGGLAVLGELKGLRRLFLWQTGVTDEGVAALQAKLPELEIVRGAELVPPPAEKVAVNSECPVSGTAVDAEFFVDVEGERVAFCCGKCKKAFEDDPAPHLEKLGLGAKQAAVNETCPVSGEAVDVAFTSAVEGKTVAFCCGECKAAFDADPGKFKDKL